MGESHLMISDYAASASKLGSLVQINSIAIDISTSAMEEMESPTVHDHFSIRGFVAGRRKKNPKTCLPFTSEGINDADLMEYLPPLLVPRFRWWQCSNCVPDIAMKSTEELEETSRSSNNVGTSSCQNVGEISMENIGNKLGVRDTADEREKYPGIKEKTNVTDKEAAGSPRGIPEANPLQTRERLNNITADASDMVCVAEHPPGINEKPAGNALSGNDGTFSAILPHRRKPKLRSLADILVEEKIPIGDNLKAVQITSTEMEAVFGPQVELNVPADVEKSTERKRKFAVEEDRGQLGLIFPSAAKRIRGLTLDAGKKCRRVEISETESEGEASMRLAQRTKPKRNKVLDIRKKITKQTHTENGTVLRREFPKISVECTANLQKRDVSRETSSGKSGEMGPYFRSILSGQQIQRISNVSADDDNLIMMPTSKSILDLSLNSYKGAERNSNSEASFVQHRGIPDLNVEFHHKTDMLHGKQFSEKRILPMHKKSFFHDGSASSSKEKSREGKNKSGFAKPPKKDSNIELGTSDDIPMEIVELLAKNQHERAAFGNSMRHINNTPRGYRALHVDEHPADTINFHPTNIRSGLTVSNRNIGFGPNNISANFNPLKKIQPDMTKPEESQFRLFTSSTPSQQRKTQFSTSSSTELLWPPMRENVPPFRLSIPHNHSMQPNSVGVHLFSDQHHKGKTICDIKDGQDKRAMLKEGRIVSGSTSIGSLDPYSNDTIPAMQLLSLMDQQVVAGSSFELGTKSFLDKRFSPCSTHHARLNGKENHNFPGGSFFPNNNHLKDISGLHSKKIPSYLQGQVPLELGNSKANPSKDSSSLAIRPARSDLALGVCTLNRNPADFSIPDARNEFTISAKDLKPRKKSTVSKEKYRLVNGEQRKIQRMKKDATGREWSKK